MRNRRRQTEVFNLSFLDVISCGFGAIILLLVISKISEPRVIEQTNVDLSGLVVQLEEELHEIRGETQILNRELIAKQEQLSENKEKLARLQGALTNIEGQYNLASTASDAQSLIEDELQSAKQELNEEMRKLLTNYQRPKEDALIGGIPVDSEYIIFVIDTSGSMQRTSTHASRGSRCLMIWATTCSPNTPAAGSLTPPPVAERFSTGSPPGRLFQTQAPSKESLRRSSVSTLQTNGSASTFSEMIFLAV
jgi:archaellum component FlaC